jgi:hypothetical protein
MTSRLATATTLEDTEDRNWFLIFVIEGMALNLTILYRSPAESRAQSAMYCRAL